MNEKERKCQMEDERIKILKDRIEELERLADERDKFIDSLVKELSEVQDLYENALKTIVVEAFTRAMLVDKCNHPKPAELWLTR